MTVSYPQSASGLPKVFYTCMPQIVIMPKMIAKAKLETLSYLHHHELRQLKHSLYRF